MIDNFYKFVSEKVQPGWFDKNKDFYISSGVNKLNKFKKEEEDKNKKLISVLKHTDIDDIKFDIDNENQLYSIYLSGQKFDYRFVKTNEENEYRIDTLSQNEYFYKIYLQFIKYLNNDTLLFEYVDSRVISPLFRGLNDYYGLFYRSYSNGELFLTKDYDRYKQQIRFLNSKNIKIIYYNNKTKGKELLDTDKVETKINKIRNKLKNITIDDITFSSPDHISYNVVLRDIDINHFVKMHDLINYRFFNREKNYDKSYFGHLRNRFHVRGISRKLRGIGLGYKIYKSFIRYIGYIISDSQSSLEARNVYYNLLKDKDLYHIIDLNKKNQPIILIWKSYPNLKKLLKIVRDTELLNNRHYEYDRRLLKYL